MAKRKWIILLGIAVLATASYAVVKPRHNELQFLEQYKVGERFRYSHVDGLPSQQTRYVTVKIDRRELRKLLAANFTAEAGWNCKFEFSPRDAEGYKFRATRGRGTILEKERITTVMTYYKQYKGEYIVFHSQPMSAFEVLIVRIKNIRRDPFHRD